MTKNKYALFFSLFIIIFLLSAGPASALEVKYPNLTVIGLPDLNTGSPSIAAYAAYFFGIGMYLAGILSLISFAIGAIGLINPSIEAHSNAKDRMKGAALGLGLTLASFLIIQTINPNLATVTMTPLTGLPGIFLVNSSTNEQVPCPLSISDTSTLPSGFNTIKYCCNELCDANSTNPKLLVWKFPNKGLETGNSDLLQVSVASVACGDTTPMGSSSFKISFEFAGVYYYAGPNCSGYASYTNTSSADEIADPFNGNGKIKGIKIVNFTDATTPANNIKYGVIFHNIAGLTHGGGCTDPITTEGCSTPTLTDAATVDIFKINQTPDTSGDGINFYSEPYGWNTGSNAGYYVVEADDNNIISNPPQPKDSGTMDFGYVDVDQPDDYQKKCKYFKNCPGSIEILGDYLVALYSDNSSGGGSSKYCQTFTKDVKNLNTEPILAAGFGNSSLKNIYIIPTQ